MFVYTFLRALSSTENLEIITEKLEIIIDKLEIIIDKLEIITKGTRCLSLIARRLCQKVFGVPPQGPSSGR
jgi:hypothetical protein